MRADGLSRRSAAGRAVRQRLRRRAAGNLVSRIIVSDDGTTLASDGRRTTNAEFLASTDERFRPVYLSNAPGRHALHRRHVSRHHPAPRLHHRVPARPASSTQARAADRPRPHLPHRARHDAARRRRRRWPATPAQLVDTLSHPNGWWRDTAQRLLVERGDASVVPALKKLATSAPDAAHAAARAVDARRPRSPRAGDGDEGAGRSRRATCARGRPPGRALAVGTQSSPPKGGRRATGRRGLGRAQQLAASLGALPAGQRETALACCPNVTGIIRWLSTAR